MFPKFILIPLSFVILVSFQNCAKRADLQVNPVQATSLDTDNDGLSDEQERNLGTDPLLADTDGDSLLDGAEVLTFKTNPLNADSDQGGLDDSLEVSKAINPLHSNDDEPNREDSDSDGLSDQREEKLGTDPNNVDTDGDGLSDGAEVKWLKTDPLDPDTDGGGLDDGVEVSQGRDPKNPNDDFSFFDYDGDGLLNCIELQFGTDPFNPDTDGDGLTDYEEIFKYQTMPLKKDTDRGGLIDGFEVENGLDPLDPADDQQRQEKDNDQDGLTNSRENALGTDKNNPDTDGDGLTDGKEVNTYGTDPLDKDTDDGGLEDGTEIYTGRDPLDPSDDLEDRVCPVEKKSGLWIDPSNTGKFSRADFVGPLAAFQSDLTGIENYGYSSYSAHPQVGPQPENDVLKFFLHRGEDGLSLQFFSGADNAPDQDWEEVELQITTTRNNAVDSVLLSDDNSEVQLIQSEGKKRVYLAKLRYKKNSDGGVIGPFGRNAKIAVKLLKTEDITTAVVVDEDGTEHSLDDQQGGFNGFIIGKKTTRNCDNNGGGDGDDDGDDGDDGDDPVFDPDLEFTLLPGTDSPDGRIEFILKNDDLVTRIDCKLDDGSYTDCSSLYFDYQGLEPGPHVFRVRLMSDNGDKKVFVYRWIIEEPQPVDVCDDANTRLVTVSFPETTETCEWEEGGNLSRRAGYIRAIRKQVQMVELGTNGKICGVQSNSQDFEFNDHFALSLNGVVLVSDMNFALKDGDNGHKVFDWNHAMNLRHYRSDREYCAGEAQGSSCEIPTSGFFGSGDLELTYPEELIESLSKENGMNAFELVVTGDNNSIDCQHGGLSLTFKVGE